jgi:hypothetical protein
MLLALEGPQTILMALSFAAMLAFVGVALWLWLRQRKPTRLPAPRSERQASAPMPSRPVSGPARTSEPARASEPHPAEPTHPSEPEPEPEPIDEPTEFVALPHLREPDSPGPTARGTEVMTVFREEPPPPEPTQFVAPPAEPTQFIAPPAEPTQSFVPEKTEFIPSPMGARAQFQAPPPPAASARVPNFEPPPSVPTPLFDKPTSAPVVDLPEHLRLAVEAFERLQREPPTPAHVDALAGHLDVLGSAPASALLDLISPMLAAAPDHRFAASLLVLLHNKAWPAKSAFPALLGELDEAHQRAALQLLRSWDDPRAPTLALGSYALAEDLDARALWLDCIAERGWDPGVAAIEAALADADPRLVTIALRLLPRSDAASRLQTKLAGLLFANDTAVRMQALETALAFGNQSAWLVCRQLARNPSFPAAAQLVGLLGTESEINEQCRAFEAAPTAELLAGLGLSGRPVVLRACVERFEDPDLELRKAAHATLTLASGSSFGSLADARTWLSSQQHPRVLDGTRRWAAQITAVLGTASEPLRRLLARELRIRSRGQVHVDASLLPHAFARQLAQVKERVAEIDFERGFPWSS